MDRATFQRRLHRAALTDRAFATRFLEEPLPESFAFRVQLNASYDANASPDFELYPRDRSPTLELDEHAVGELLYRAGRVPQWIDIQVVAETGEETVFELLCCGRFTDDDARLYYATTDHAPFGIKGPTLPIQYAQGQRFSIYHPASWRTVPPTGASGAQCRQGPLPRAPRTGVR